MYPFLETIRFNSIIVPFVQEHQDRINRTFLHFYPDEKPLDLANILREIKAQNQDFLLGSPVVKCRLCYNDSTYKYDLEPYQIKKIETITLKQVADDFDYTFKYADRTLLNNLKGNENEILMLKKGLVTDTSYANIAFFDGKKWVTPEKPLLEGTKRSALLQHKIIQTLNISVEDLQKFSHFKLFNAMIDWQEATTHDISKIKL